jgi:hypothetical protein
MVTGRPQTSTASRVARGRTAERLGGYIYGTIVVLAVIVAGARAYPHEVAHIAWLALATAVVFWLAHVYAHAVAHSVARNEHLSLAELRHIARREAAIIEAAVPPLVPLVLGALGLLSTKSAVWIAFVLGLIVLGSQGIVVARVERLGRLGMLAVVAGNVSLGVLLVGLKLAVSH